MKTGGNENHVQVFPHPPRIGPLETAATEHQNAEAPAVLGADESNIVMEIDPPSVDSANAVGGVPGIVPTHANYPSISGSVDSPPGSPALRSQVTRTSGKQLELPKLGPLTLTDFLEIR